MTDTASSTIASSLTAPDWRRALPSVDRLLDHPTLRALAEQYGQRLCTRVARDTLTALRQSPRAPGLDEAALARQVSENLLRFVAPNARAVFNLTGTVIHTNLGRALLSEPAIDAMAQVARYPVALEYDIASGGRGDRDDLIEALICELTGAEAATVVNNNAAAVVLTLGALGAGREAIVSRGELIEIGGAFRMPDIMAAAGCRLREVGTTNRTHPKDYREAINEETGLLIKVHTSNYAIEGFTRAVDEADMAEIAHAAGLPLVVDLGSGALTDLSRLGLPYETQPSDAIAAGADVVTFSGDKLLGGPQAGIIAGKREFIERIKRHPLKRALRLDKLVLAALEATLKHYRDDDHPAHSLPTLRLLTREADLIQAAGERVLAGITTLPAGYRAHLAPCMSQLGSGSLPVDRLPSTALVLESSAPRREAREQALKRLECACRELSRPIIGRIRESALWLDLRCLAVNDEQLLAESLTTALAAAEAPT
ncbi:L-seryl-tRNA(Sec) selenium transferase [Halomonas sp. PAMB 3264]|uniref:L-seryl-tRNA(Sec) selenium transferase n=1 Tax=Halomonas sp. PAMB 3264 TaxID=3075222 RepID=UPI002896F5C2|nr:L-seryl-tRNA(Sec) selenium transferase [Halomonas sp. PAMB 3264]WNL41927.1 L-seryl-tRNA(Sec) selenium transferase [Halomonas sp. PAMB 3264]